MEKYLPRKYVRNMVKNYHKKKAINIFLGNILQENGEYFPRNHSSELTK
jgi:hypothetical protein